MGTHPIFESDFDCLTENSKMMWLYLTIGLLCLGYLWILNRWQYWKRRGVSGPTPSILGMGNSKELFAFNRDTGMGKWIKDHGETFGLYFLWIKPTLIVSDPEIVKEICVKQFSRFTTRGRDASQKIFGKMSNDFMTVLEGKRWKRLRSSIVPFFSGSKLSAMTPILNNSAAKVVADLVEPAAKTGDTVEVQNFSQEYTMSAIMASGFSVDAMENESLMKSGISHGRALLDSNFWASMFLMFIPERLRFYFNITMYPRKTDKWFRDLAESLQQNARLAKQNGEKLRPDFISLMTTEIIPEVKKENATKGFTDNEIVAQAFLFILAGFNTTSDVLKFVLYNLALNQDAQEELFQLVRAEMKSDKEISYESLKKLKLLDATLKESQRIYTTTILLGRECDEDTVVKGIPIEKGTMVFWDIDGIHHNESYYKDPHVFNPHRFDGDESNTLQDDAWFGFGYGPRACPAVRWAFIAMKIFLARIVNEYKIVKTAKTLEPNQWKMAFKGLTLGPSEPLLIGFEKRN